MPGINEGTFGELGHGNTYLHLHFVSHTVVHQEATTRIYHFRGPVTGCCKGQGFHRATKLAPVDQVSRVENAETFFVMPEARAVSPIFSAIFEDERGSEGTLVDRIEISSVNFQAIES